MGSVRFALIVAVPLIAAIACGPDAPKAEPTASNQTPKAEDPPRSDAPAKPAMPPQARRNSPPEGMEILAEGAPSPALSNLPATTGSWSRSSAKTIVAFYRGHW